MRYTIQIGAFHEAVKAAEFAQNLDDLGLDAYYFIDADGLYKVRFNHFELKDDAVKLAKKLQSRGRIQDYYIAQPYWPGKENGLGFRDSLIKTAMRFIGVRYRWGGVSAENGFDCSGLTMIVYRLNGMRLPRDASSQYYAGKQISRESLKKGDLVFFATGGRSHLVTHVGIYTGNNKFIHAPRTGKTVRTSSLENGYYKKRYLGARTYLDRTKVALKKSP
ncbi:MAG: hydrolase [Desulfobacteraceae bacterium]|nr:hydrolase [Desulfobacteraceae bacterium]